MQFKQMPKMVLAAMLAVGMWPGQSGASNLDVGELAALLVVPIITGGQDENIENASGDVIVNLQNAHTLVTVTNASSDNRNLVINVVSGDFGEDAWDTDSFVCPLTGRETTTFVFSPAGSGQSSMHVECGTITTFGPGFSTTDTDGAEIRATTVAQNGFMVISVADPLLPRGADVIGENSLFADAVVVDPRGQAYSFSALSFQATGGNNGDRAYEFGPEYAELPSVLASNFLAESPDNDVEAELILLTLDGQPGGNFTPRVSLHGDVYDDDENKRNFNYDFDCFDIVSLSELSDGFIFDANNSLNLQSPTGHFDLATRNAGTNAADVHDFNWGDNNGIRNRGAHGWIVQNVNGVLLQADQPITGVAAISSGRAAWGRPLLQSTTALVPAGGDTPVFDGE